MKVLMNLPLIIRDFYSLCSHCSWLPLKMQIIQNSFLAERLKRYEIYLLAVGGRIVHEQIILHQLTWKEGQKWQL